VLRAECLHCAALRCAALLEHDSLPICDCCLMLPSLPPHACTCGKSRLPRHQCRHWPSSPGCAQTHPRCLGCGRPRPPHPASTQQEGAGSGWGSNMQQHQLQQALHSHCCCWHAMDRAPVRPCRVHPSLFWKHLKPSPPLGRRLLLPPAKRGCGIHGGPPAGLGRQQSQ